MKNSKRLIACLITCVVTASLFAGCSPKATSVNGSSKVSKIKWSTWGNVGELSRFKEFTTDFNKKNPSIQAELIPIPSDGYEQKILTQLAAGTAPDVFYSGDASIQKFVRDNRVMEISQQMTNSATLKPDSIYENLYGAAKQADKIYGVTVDDNPFVLYYNVDMLKSMNIKTPQEYIDAGNWDMNAFAEITTKVHAGGKYGFVQGNGWGANSLFANTANIGYFSPDGKTVTIDNADTIAGLDWMSKLIKAKAVVYTGSLPKGQGDDAMFMSNQLAMCTAGRWYVPEFKKITAFKWDIAPYPKSLTGKDAVVGIPTAYLCINKDSKNPKQAFTFLENFVNKAGQTFRLTGGGNAVPSYKDAELDKVVAEGNIPPHAKYLLDARNIGKVIPIGSQMYPEADKAINDTLDLLWLGKLDAATAAKQAQTKGTAAIK